MEVVVCPSLLQTNSFLFVCKTAERVPTPFRGDGRRLLSERRDVGDVAMLAEERGRVECAAVRGG